MARAFIALVVAAAIVGGFWWLGLPAALQPAISPDASPAGPAGIGSPLAIPAHAAAWAAAFRPSVAAADDTARRLAAMGQQKSRDLLAIRAAQREMIGRLGAADAFLREHPTPAGADAAVAAYREGAARIRAAMDDALAGFLRFDWDRVRRATAELTAGEAALARTLAALDQAVATAPAG
jgi:hypothetical protein